MWDITAKDITVQDTAVENSPFQPKPFCDSVTMTILCTVTAMQDISVRDIAVQVTTVLDLPATRTPVPRLPDPSALHRTHSRPRRGREGRAGGKGRAGPLRPPPPRPAAHPPAQPAPRRRASVAAVGAMGGAALSGALCLGLLWRLWAGAGGSCSERCCQGRDAACVSSGWREDGGYGSCYCDGGCRRTRDCCHDHGQACPAHPCVVGEWSHWSGCAEQCKPNLRIRRRYVQQEPTNAGEPCPALEEKAGCLEYLTYQGQDCGHEHVPAFITTSEYGKERKPRAASSPWPSDKETGYCVEFRTESLSHYCALENRPFARWMQYLREGHTVCVACQPPAMNTDTRRCSGDGHNADGGKILHWEAVGNSRCQGTWKKIRQLEQCSCPLVHSFIFT
ncbi:LOW QUALITY PROTEIN: somatomedin-B and thrombospondin type-1 domain-containing protein [Numida meleagris]|uniref:LOW QUALITY PROTEIN: somatomedin-B and thrombospondin type-1 domain-containing protein n=1 Tax=Numida meleagris TaxID=8996 RepID=UPI000B3DFB6B|nr:LOW QUALITY PROTEIN: somatomedin-B and thrombospondin type-1 domain-containing protein [Numida meleagris]